MNSSTRKSSLGQACVFSICWLVSSALDVSHAFENDTTHATLTELAVYDSQLRLDAQLLPSLGLNPYGENTFPISPTSFHGSEYLTTTQMIIDGSVREDVPFTRVLYHFFDPQNNRGLNADTVIGPIEFVASPDWILEDVSLSEATADQDFSYRDARANFYAALTNGSAIERAYYYGRTFKSLGHVLHHIQDMGQPQHVRNEPHCDKPFLCDEMLEALVYAKLYVPSLLEEHVASRDQSVRYQHAISPYPVDRVTASLGGTGTPRDFWVNSRVPNGGMAEYSAKNFLTQGSSLEWNPAQNSFRGIAGYPLPDGSAMQIDFEDCTWTGSKGQASGSCGFVSTSAYDPVLATTDSYRIASLGLIWYPIQSLLDLSGADDQYVSGLFVIDEDTLIAQGNILVRRTIAFSAALIDYFFRGNVNLVFDPGGATWRIQNNGAEEVDGLFQLFSDDSENVRTPVESNGWLNRQLRLAPGASSAPIAFSAPSDNRGNFMLTFSGRIGNEGNQAQNTLIAVAGKQIVVPHVTITYGDNGALLDDRFELYIDNVLVSSDTSPFSATTVSRTLAPGQHKVDLKYLSSIYDPDDGPTWYISFSSNAQVICCGPTSGESNVPWGTVFSWDILVQ